MLKEKYTNLQLYIIKWKYIPQNEEKSLPMHQNTTSERLTISNVDKDVRQLALSQIVGKNIN